MDDELYSENLVFNPLRPGREHGRFVGEGGDRVLELARGATVPIGRDPVKPDPIDWDF